MHPKCEVIPMQGVSFLNYGQNKINLYNCNLKKCVIEGTGQAMIL